MVQFGRRPYRCRHHTRKRASEIRNQMHPLRAGSPRLVRNHVQALTAPTGRHEGRAKNSAFNFFFKNPTNCSRRKDVKMILVNNHWCRIQKLYGASPDGFRERLQPDTAPVFIVRVLLNEQRFACKCAEHRFPNRAEGWRRKRTCSTSFLGVITLSAFNG